jgi:hypothetical protein
MDLHFYIVDDIYALLCMEGVIITERAKMRAVSTNAQSGRAMLWSTDVEVAQLWKFGLKSCMSYFPWYSLTSESNPYKDFHH